MLNLTAMSHFPSGPHFRRWCGIFKAPPLSNLFIFRGFPAVIYLVVCMENTTASPPAQCCMFWTGLPDDSCSHNAVQLVCLFLPCFFSSPSHLSLEFLPRPLGLQRFEHILFKQFCKSYYSAAVIYSRITIFRVKEGFWYGTKMGTNAVKEKKGGKKRNVGTQKRRKGGKKPHERWSLKINEKIGNPWVTAWIKENQYLLLNSLGPSKILEMNKSCEFCCQYHPCLLRGLVLQSLKYKIRWQKLWKL